MPLRLTDRTATLAGTVTVDETEQLAAWLRSAVRPRVNLRACTHLHTSALQVLLVAAPEVSSAPQDPFLHDHVLPLLRGAAERRSAGVADPPASGPQVPEGAADGAVSDVPGSEALDRGADEAALVGTDAG